MPPPATRASATGLLGFIVESSDVEAMMRRVAAATTGAQLGLWLGGMVDPYLRNRAAQRFATEGDAAVGQWAPLEASTVQIRQSEGYGGAHPINRRTGELEDYITDMRGRVHFTGQTAILDLPGGGTPPKRLQDKYKQAQQGGVGPSGKTSPARPVLGLDGLDLQFVMGSLDLILTSTMTGTGHFTAAGAFGGGTP